MAEKQRDPCRMRQIRQTWEENLTAILFLSTQHMHIITYHAPYVYVAVQLKKTDRLKKEVLVFFEYSSCSPRGGAPHQNKK